MKTVYELRLDRARSGSMVDLDGGATSMPSPAVVCVSRSGDAVRYWVTVELVAGAWPVVTEITIAARGETPAAITAAGLRDMRFGELQRVVVSHLRRSAEETLWPDQETFTFVDLDGTAEETQRKLEELLKPGESDWKKFLPRTMLDNRPGAESALRSDPEWLLRAKEGGARSERALRVTAAIYRRAVETGSAPNLAVGRFLELPKSTASEWIAKARDRGYLDQSPRKPRSDSGGVDG